MSPVMVWYRRAFVVVWLLGICLRPEGLIPGAKVAGAAVTRATEIAPAGCASPPGGAGDGAQVARRVPWVGSRLRGTPDPPPPYTVVQAFPGLKFESPVVLVRAPGTDRLFLGELKGRIYSFRDDPNCKQADLALDVAKLHPELTMFYGLVCHPRFNVNRYIYVCYALKNDVPDGSVVSRFTVSGTDPPVIDSRSEKVFLTFWSGGHNGGCLVFGNEGYLYISTGDGAGPSPPDTKLTGQDCSDLLSSVLRIDIDHADPGKAYRVPVDNPFINVKGARPEIWAFGFRNPWKMSVDRTTGELWVGDVGWELWEMIEKVERGGNYGWSVMEGPQPVHVEGRRGPAPILPPTKAHPHSEAASITGGYVYRGARLPELAGTYIYGDFQTGTVWGLRYQGGTIIWQRELARTPLHLVAFGETNGGELYQVDHDRTHQIYRLVPNPAARTTNDFPRTLSQTGLFASTRDHQPAAGVVPYSVNSELWSDGATAERLLAIPGTGHIVLDQQGNWKFPDGAVLVRTVSIDAEPGKRRRRRRVETQILHLETDSWRPYSYVWNDEETDAELVGAQGTTLTFATTASGPRDRSYRVYSRSECVLCHNPWVEKKTSMFGIQSASPLGVNAYQINKAQEGGRNQLATLHGLGLLAWTPDPERLPRLVDPYDASADLDRRARSYLETNCAHCHQFNAGGAANIALGYNVPLADTRMVDVRPIQGTFSIAGARIIAPGDPTGSVLYYRVSKLGAGRMPRVGSTQVDERASRMIHDWIARMPRSAASDPGGGLARAEAEDRAALESLRVADRLPGPARAAAVRRLTSSTRGALMLLSLFERREASESLQREVLAIIRDSPQVEIRDLFERFVPPSERLNRLGDVVDRSAILALRGDASRGREVFASNAAAQCKNCHKARNVGENVGPDLTRIGAKYGKAALLEQILDPSKTIEPQYVAYLVETKNGRVLTGLVAERNGQSVVLKDNQGKTVRVPAGDVERLVPQSRSLMPDLLLRDLTAQQVADLLEFLATMK
ncbi:MAG: PQQ-dependent sugar dehydrogenase [Isosphaeraceae bacterium]